MTKDTSFPISFRTSPEIKAAAQRAAAEDHRSLSSLIEKVLAEHLRKQGYLRTKK